MTHHSRGWYLSYTHGATEIPQVSCLWYYDLVLEYNGIYIIRTWYHRSPGILVYTWTFRNDFHVSSIFWVLDFVSETHNSLQRSQDDCVDLNFTWSAHFMYSGNNIQCWKGSFSTFVRNFWVTATIIFIISAINNDTSVGVIFWEGQMPEIGQIYTDCCMYAEIWYTGLFLVLKLMRQIEINIHMVHCTHTDGNGS